jgi:hypothetical protein
MHQDFKGRFREKIFYSHLKCHSGNFIQYFPGKGIFYGPENIVYGACGISVSCG